MPEAAGSDSIRMPEGQPEDLQALFNLTAAMAYTLIDRMVSARLGKAAPANAKVTIWPELFGHVREIVSSVYADHGLELPEPGNGNPTSQYYHMVLRKLGESRDPFEAGSLLPWIEIKIRRDAEALAKAAPQCERQASSLRDRLIAEQAAAGISPSDLSQAFGIKRAAIERIIARLSGESEELRRTA